MLKLLTPKKTQTLNKHDRPPFQVLQAVNVQLVHDDLGEGGRGGQLGPLVVLVAVVGRLRDIVVDELGVAGVGLARVGDQGLDVLGDCVVGGRGAAVGGREALQLALQAVHVQVVVLLGVLDWLDVQVLLGHDHILVVVRVLFLVLFVLF